MAARHSKRQIVEIPVGTRVGKLTVTGRSEKKGRDTWWRCHCDCGRETEATTSDLRRGHKKSCGCICPHFIGDLLDRLPRMIRVTENGCWIWGQGKRGKHKNTWVNGKSVNLHRAIYERLKGPIPDNLYVCHNCPGGDNPDCVNPDHLWLGTHAENMRDAVEKEQYAHGEKHWNAKLSNSEVQEVFREFHVKRRSKQSIAEQFGIHRRTVGDIVNRESQRRATEELARELGIP